MEYFLSFLIMLGSILGFLAICLAIAALLAFIINTKNDELILVRSDGARMEETNHGKDPVPVPAQL